MISLVVIVIPLVAAALLLPMTAVGGRGGLTPKQLLDHGWHCFDHPTLGVHCAAPGQEWPPSGPTTQLLYFFNTHELDSTVPDFTGTETLIHHDYYNGQPCPTEGRDEFLDLFPIVGLPYWACHRR